MWAYSLAVCMGARVALCLDCMEDVLLVVGGGIGPRECKEQCRTFEVFPLSLKALKGPVLLAFPPLLEGQRWNLASEFSPLQNFQELVSL